MAARIKQKTTPGPAYRAAAGPVSTKIPVPIIAPIPSATRFKAPNERFNVCSPCSPASSVSIDIGLPRSRLDGKDRFPPWRVSRAQAEQNPPKLVRQSYDTAQAIQHNSPSAPTQEH